MFADVVDVEVEGLEAVSGLWVVSVFPVAGPLVVVLIESAVFSLVSVEVV